jgi:GTP-binding protein
LSAREARAGTAPDTAMARDTHHSALLPVIAIVGRPNVGKSTLFNCLTRSRSALVADEPGLTRDRLYGFGKGGAKPYAVVETGGLTDDEDPMARAISAQAGRAVEESHAVVFMVDGREGLNAADETIASELRASGKPVIVAVNKTEGLEPSIVCAEFHSLGFDSVLALSAAHGRGVEDLLQAALARVPSHLHEPPAEDTGIKVSIVGRPNVGKSTLINAVLGDERLVAHDAPGTTRDSVHVPFERGGRRYTLIDTAGIRRRARVSEKIEKFSVVKALQAIAAADVVVAVVDGAEGVTDQDTALLGVILDAGRSLTVVVNKWDLLDRHERHLAREHLARKLRFLDFATVHYLSALQGTGFGRLFRSVDEAWRAASKDLSTPELNAMLAKAVERNPPPVVRGRRIKLRYAHQGGSFPPVIVIHGNQTEHVPGNYRRYLEKVFRKSFALHGTPVRLEFRSSENPYKGQRNPLSPRQTRKRKRLIRHVKRKG